jgi:hypothetical protein
LPRRMWIFFSRRSIYGADSSDVCVLVTQSDGIPPTRRHKKLSVAFPTGDKVSRGIRQQYKNAHPPPYERNL